MPHDISQWIVKIPVLLFAITLHEYAHGKVALWFGDPTAQRMGRLTLNPLPHIDPFGAICLFLFNFGWAKPVPVDTRYFRNPRQGTILMAFAGPCVNLFVALCAGLALRFFLLPSELYQLALFYLMFMNLGLGLFNLIPIPPLDGSHILENVLPPGPALSYRRIGRYGPMIILGIVMLDNFAHTGILSRILITPMKFLAHLFSGITF